MLFDAREINLSIEIENYVRDEGGMYMDAIIVMCERFNIEASVAAKHLTKPIVEKLRAEGEELNMLPRTARLPF